MDVSKIQSILSKVEEFSEVHVRVEGSHYEIIVISDLFLDMKRVQQQQAVYAPLMQYIASGDMHAVTIKTFTLQQWQREKVFHLPG
tara:strand:- start:7771 stop:8028 length:258 start_codon:yes stop_codon:yes gene_type:complete